MQHDNCGELRDLVLFVQFKKREKYPWRSVNFSNFSKFNFSINLAATLLKLTVLHGCFSRFLNGTDGTKSRNVPQLWTAHLAIKKKLFYSESEENKYPSSTPFSEIFSSSL